MNEQDAEFVRQLSVPAPLRKGRRLSSQLLDSWTCDLSEWLSEELQEFRSMLWQARGLLRVSLRDEVQKTTSET